jgi:hypothetical protein
MSSWSKRRKYIYMTVTAVVVVGVIVIPAFYYFYKAPTCFDGRKNGNEQGVDCGGACQKLCASAFLPAKIDWTRYEKIAPGVYNLAAYIENPNTDAGAHSVPFHMVLYDSTGVPIADVRGTVTLPPHRNTLAFIPGVNVAHSLPSAQPFFEFTAAPDWNKETDPLLSVVIGDQKYSEDESGSSLQVTLSNTSVQSLPRLDIYVVLYDANKNTIGFSKTVLDGIPGNGSSVAPFTWPENHNGAVISQEVLPVAE